MTFPKAKKQQRDLTSVLADADAALARQQRERVAEDGAEASRVEEGAFPNVEANAFYRILFEEGVSPEAKRDALVEALTFALDADSTASKERLAAYATFKGYLQYERRQLALEVIRLTDTGAFAELQQVLRDLNSGVVEFDEQMRPLTDIIDAVYQLRMAGNTIDVFHEIQEEKAAEADRRRRLDEKDQEVATLAARQQSLEKAIAAERERKSLLRFFGGEELTRAARMEIARLDVESEDVRRRLDAVRRDVERIRAEGSPESRFAEFAAQKEKLRELLDLTTENHQQRQRDLVESAERFVRSTSDRVSRVLEHLEKMSGQADALYENNDHMRHAYAILSDGEREAGARNQENRERLQGAPENESSIQRMDRERRLEGIEDYVMLLDSATVDTAQTLKDLTEQGGSIKTMRDSNRQQMDRTSKLHSSSVSGVSERLATVLQAVSAAALNEATGGAKASIEHMTASTRRILGQKAIENAVGMQETVDDLDKAIEQLREFGELQEKATGLTREALSEIGAKMGELERATEKAAGELRRSIAVHADAELHKRGGEADAESEHPVRAPFQRFG